MGNDGMGVELSVLPDPSHPYPPHVRHTDGSNPWGLSSRGRTNGIIAEEYMCATLAY